jgi:hypothetical protein
MIFRRFFFCDAEVSFLDAEQKRTKEPRREPIQPLGLLLFIHAQGQDLKKEPRPWRRPSLSAVSKQSEIPAQTNA